MSSPRPESGDQLRDAIRAQQKASRERLAREATDLAKRLNLAYRRVVEDVSGQLKLAEQGIKDKQPDTRVLQSLQEKFQEALDDFKPALESAAKKGQAGGIREGRASGVAALRIDPAMDSFAAPLIETIQAGADYVDSPAWRAKFAGFDDFHAERAADIVLGGIANGENPNTTAARLRRYMVGQGGMPAYPLVDAIRNARTVQVYSARSGSLAVYRANGVERWIWDASLDDQVCFSCLVMHGTVHPVSETLNDHHSGRCAMLPVTPSWSDLGFEDGREVDHGVSGEVWFLKEYKTEAERRERMGAARWRAWKDGLFSFEQLSTTYDDDVYGPMRREASLVELIGEQAARQYRNGAGIKPEGK